MSNNDLKIELDFDSILENNQNPRKLIGKKRNLPLDGSSDRIKSGSKLKKESKKPSNSIDSDSISISLDYDQIHLNIEYSRKEDEENPTIIEILTELKEKL